MNQLLHIDEFRTILADYHMSPSAKQTLQETKLALIVGPTSSGRDTIINELLKTGAYHGIVTDTTRQPRVNNGIMEQNGREYWFRSEEAFLEDVRHGGYLEAAIIHNQQVSGVSIREVARPQQTGKIAITDIEPNGAANVHRLKPEAIIMFVIPPSMDAWLERLRKRGDMPDEEVRRRLETAYNELQTALDADFYTFVVNDALPEAVAQVDARIRQGVVDAQEQARLCAQAEQLRSEVRQYLDRLQPATHS